MFIISYVYIVIITVRISMFLRQRIRLFLDHIYGFYRQYKAP